MNNMDLNEIDGLNDRRNLVLRLNKENKTAEDQSVIAILKTVYPDFLYYHIDKITTDLQQRGFIEYVDLYPELPDTDDEGNENKDKYKWITTKDGERALAVKLFPSEYKAKKLDEKRREKESENLDLSNKELRRNRFISWAALAISIISIIIAAAALLSD